VFIYDGEELFPSEELAHAPYIDQSGEDATSALTDIIRSAHAPLIVQLKPAQELLSLDANLMRKTSVLFYGSFNFRKTASEHLPLQSLLDYFSEHFAQVGVVESYGMLGDQSTVYHGHTWTHGISKYIEGSDQPFLSMFRKLVTNWNRYLLEDHLPDVRKAIVSLSELTRIDFEWELSTVDRLIAHWNLDLFLELKHKLLEAVTLLQASNPTDALTRAIERIQWVIKFTDLIKPESGLQFTLADVGLALALVDHTGVFSSRPVRFIVSNQGFLTPVDSPESSVFYYDRVEKEAFSRALLDQLRRMEENGLDSLDNLDILD
jgi:hypothetical protein